MEERTIILASYGRKTWLPLAAVLLAGAGVCALTCPWLSAVFGLILVFVLWFFRDPERRSNADGRSLVSPADGKIVEIASADESEHIGGPATKIAIFMSVFNVHVNRAPTGAKVEWVRHEPGRFMNALTSRAGIENEHMLVALRDRAERPLLLNLVAGLIARRIVCPLKPGEDLDRGQRLGMIQFGSRVEVFVPAGENFEVAVRLGQRVRAGESILGEWR